MERYKILHWRFITKDIKTHERRELFFVGVDTPHALITVALDGHTVKRHFINFSS